MESNRNKAKRVAKEFRQLTKRFFDDFYARAAKDGRHPLPVEAMVAFGRIFDEAVDEWPETPPHPQLSKYAFQDLLASNLFQQICEEAGAAHGRHMPGLNFKKGKPGRPINAEEVERIAEILPEKSYREAARELLRAEPEGEAKELLVNKEAERIRALKRRHTRSRN